MIDPFAGSCITGEVCERLGRRWLCLEIVEEYLQGALGRFKTNGSSIRAVSGSIGGEAGNSYKICRPGILWNNLPEEPLSKDGGAKRPPLNNSRKIIKVSRLGPLFSEGEEGNSVRRGKQ